MVSNLKAMGLCTILRGANNFFWRDHGDLERHKLMVAHGEQLLSKLRNEKKKCEDGVAMVEI